MLFRGLPLPLRIQADRILDGAISYGSVSPPVGMSFFGFFQGLFPLGQYFLGFPPMPLFRGHVVEGTVTMGTVVPGDESPGPGSCLLYVLEAAAWKGWPVLQGFEDGFAVGVVVAYPRSAVGEQYSQFFHGGSQGGAFHGASVVGVQNQGFVRKADFFG